MKGIISIAKDNDIVMIVDGFPQLLVLAIEVYHTKTVHPSGKITWQGGKDLPASAFFTREFVQAILGCWERHHGLDQTCGEDAAAPGVILIESDSDQD